MKCLTVVWLSLIAAAGAWGDCLPEIDGLPFFPQSRLERLPFFEQTTVQAYRASGSRNPKWDTNAETGLLLYGRLLCFDQAIYGTTNFPRMVGALKGAVGAGCDDPLVFSAALRLRSRAPEVDPRPALETAQAMIAGLKVHAYPANVQGWLYFRAGTAVLGNPAATNEARVWLENAFTNLGEAVARKADRTDLYDLAGQLFPAYRRATGNPQAIYERLQAQWTRLALGTNPVARAISAACLLGWTDESPRRRGKKSETSESFKRWVTRVERAEELLDAAWQQDPTDLFVCKQRLTALTFQFDKPAEFDEWFERGKKLDPDDYGLYSVKLRFMQTRVPAGRNRAISFGRECLKTENWREQIPFILVDAHEKYGSPEYFQQPEVWDDVKQVHEGYLKRFPGNNVVRSSYCYCAYVAQQWDLARELLAQLGDFAVPAMFRGEYQKCREELLKGKR